MGNVNETEVEERDLDGEIASVVAQTGLDPAPAATLERSIRGLIRLAIDQETEQGYFSAVAAEAAEEARDNERQRVSQIIQSLADHYRLKGEAPEGDACYVRVANILLRVLEQVRKG